MSNKKIYLDYNATTPCDPRVVKAMLPYFTEHFGNAASRSHPFGWAAEEAVDQARDLLAKLLKADAKEIVFTSGATEAVNLALKGVFEMYHRKGRHIVTLKTEHNAVLDTCLHLEKMGAEVTYLDVNSEGLVDLAALEAAIRNDTILVAVMWANNETGVLQPIREIGEICGRKEVLFFSDATQAVGKIPTHPRKMGIHLMACSAHKMYGPKGVGALYVSRKNPKVKLTAQMDGGGHEKGFRSGTLNVPGIVGFGKAAEVAMNEMEKESERLRKLRDRLENTLLKLEETYVNGHRKQRMTNVANLSFLHVESEQLLSTFHHEIAISTGSACTSASLEPSHVLMAMSVENDLAHSAIRLSLGKFTKEKEVDFVIAAVKKSVTQLRKLSPRWEMFKDGVDLKKMG